MAELDYEYLDRLLKKAKEDDSDALAELYAATYRKQYRYACQYIEDLFWRRISCRMSIYAPLRI
ncbi:MAG: hypothetical protein ACLTLQ_02775 [[Clostridium] scindens]